MIKQKAIHSWREAFSVYLKARVVGMFFLGFSAGLPYVLVFGTLTAWLTEENISRTTIGFFSWVGLMYSVKVFWAPLVDRIPLPILTKMLGQRRSWLLVSQISIAIGLLFLTFTAPQDSIQLFAFYALIVAFSSATQDIVIDAYRIESIEKEYQAAMSASYVYGYKMAGISAGAGALYIADILDWQITYIIMTALTCVGIITTLIIREPKRHLETGTLETEKKMVHLVGNYVHKKGIMQEVSVWITSAVISPFVDFFRRNGKMAIVILFLIGTYRITDVTMVVMANPFYLDMGFTKSEIASITKLASVVLFFVGALIGGVLTVRFGVLRTLLMGGFLVIGSNLLFAWLSMFEPDVSKLALVISADSLAGGVATTVFLAYLSSLTNSAYTATQYALFSSLMTLFPKLIGGFSGIVVDAYGYFSFYIYSSVLGVPALLVIVYLMRQQKFNPKVSCD